MNTKYFMKLALLFLGNLSAAFGVFLCVASQKGADPITVLLDGIMKTCNVQIGIAVIILHTVLIIICSLFDRKSIKSGTIFSIFTFSISLNFFIANYLNLIIPKNIFLSWSLLLFGIVFMGVGFSVGIFANIGCNTADISLNILSTKTGLGIKTCKNILDLAYTLLGIILGGTFGIGTLLCVLLVGSVYSSTLQLLEKTKQSVTYKKIYN
ncbi:MAG: hypothetical protein R3Y47_10965 [Lachnospiraceae bacterium]